MSCPNQAACPLFQHFRVDGTLSVWRTFYCDADHARCERYQRSQAGTPVPSTLLPNGEHLEGRGDEGEPA